VGAACTPGRGVRARTNWEVESTFGPLIAFPTILPATEVTEPHRQFTCVHPSDLPLARFARMVRVCLGLHPSAVARFVTWRLQGSGTGLDTIQSRDNESRLLNWFRAASRPNRVFRVLSASGGEQHAEGSAQFMDLADGVQHDLLGPIQVQDQRVHRLSADLNRTPASGSPAPCC